MRGSERKAWHMGSSYARIFPWEGPQGNSSSLQRFSIRVGRFKGRLSSGNMRGNGNEEALDQVKLGMLVSSAFAVWQDDGQGGPKGRLVINFHQQSQHWAKGSPRMKALPGFALDLQKGDHLMSWDIKPGYRHFRLHPRMRNMLLLRRAGRLCRCAALPFGWGRSVWWLTKLLRPLARHLRGRWPCRALPWIDDFLLAPGRMGKGQRRAIARQLGLA